VAGFGEILEGEMDEVQEIYERIEREGSGTFAELTLMLVDLNKRLQRIEGDRVTHPDGKEFVRVDDHWMPEHLFQ
jgi:hypothetical protein